MDENSFMLSIPVAPHVYKFLNSLFGEFYYLSMGDSLGSFIIGMLQKEQKMLYYSLKPIKEKKMYKIVASNSIYEKQGIQLNEREIRYIGVVVDNYFREQCFSTAIFAKQQYGKEIAVSIRDFCQFYNITDEDINYESLYRHFFRKRDENFPNFVSNLCKKAGI